ncbi:MULTISPECIES: hypothetical protein [unclassified Clostridium]|nr:MULTISPECIES: hypothetical protein [unclassified Clostridium]EKQ57238.1 MAG: hypothetical protein A370_01055 [Clostridium sp. Maddingley MBC34-26]
MFTDVDKKAEDKCGTGCLIINAEGNLLLRLRCKRVFTINEIKEDYC